MKLFQAKVSYETTFDEKISESYLVEAPNYAFAEALVIKWVTYQQDYKLDSLKIDSLKVVKAELEQQKLREDQAPEFYLATYQVDTLNEAGVVTKSTTRKLFLSVEDFHAAYSLAVTFIQDYEEGDHEERVISIKDTPIVAFLEDSIVDRFILGRKEIKVTVETQSN